MRIPITIKPIYLLKSGDFGKLYIEYLKLSFIERVEQGNYEGSKVSDFVITPSSMLLSLVAKSYLEERYETIKIKDTEIRLQFDCEDFGITSVCGSLSLVSYDLSKLILFYDTMSRCSRVYKFLSLGCITIDEMLGEKENEGFQRLIENLYAMGSPVQVNMLELAKERLLKTGSYYDDYSDMVYVLRGSLHERDEQN